MTCRSENSMHKANRSDLLSDLHCTWELTCLECIRAFIEKRFTANILEERGVNAAFKAAAAVCYMVSTKNWQFATPLLIDLSRSMWNRDAYQCDARFWEVQVASSYRLWPSFYLNLLSMVISYQVCSYPCRSNSKDTSAHILQIHTPFSFSCRLFPLVALWTFGLVAAHDDNSLRLRPLSRLFVHMHKVHVLKQNTQYCELWLSEFAWGWSRRPSSFWQTVVPDTYHEYLQ